MKEINYFLTIISFLLLTSMSSFAVVPTFDMSIRNITTYPDPVTGADSLLTFDFYIQWTNPGVSDPFEYSGSHGALFINHEVFNGGVIYGMDGLSSLQRQLTPLISDLPYSITIFHTECLKIDENTDALDFSSRVPASPSQNFIISDVFPGTRIMRFKLRTTAHTWNFVTPNLEFSHQVPYNSGAQYFLPSTDPKDPDYQLHAFLYDTTINNYIIESNFVLPVELQFFTSSVHKNIVTLNWTTTSELNNQGFDIERKLIGIDEWVRAGFVNGNGTTNITSYYDFTERLHTGQYYYRLKQIDFNSNYNYYQLINKVIVSRPGQYSISQNYPNPFNPVTKINYDLLDDANVSITLFDMTGKEIRTLLDESKTAGLYTLEFDASGLPSGIYFYKMTATGTDVDFSDLKKMILLK